jgi:hypothetical protein
MSVAVDIAKHFDTRLHQLVEDTFDTCRSGGMSTKDAARMLVSVLLAETVLGMVSTGLSEEQAVEYVTFAHREMTRKINQRKRKPRARAGT